ncbi:hypothetical protein J7J84_06580 [bacterium]|nr:hypothetical protein [bacterium]
MKRILSIGRGARFCAFGCVLLLILTTAAYAKTFSGKKPQFDPAKLGRYVLFPGIDQPVRVAGLYAAASDEAKWAEKRLPDDIVDKLIRARDRNAFWLLCEDRRDYSSIAYTYVFANNAGLATRVRPVEGPYDRGVNFKVPSEYVLFQSDVSECEYANEDGYFKMILAPTPMPEDRYYGTPIPSYVKWASPIRVAWTNGWMPVRSILVLDEYRLKENFVNGCEMWFAEDDLRLVKEIITEPTALEDGSGWDYSQAVPVKEVEYNYTDYSDIERDFPKHVIVRENGVVRLEMEFKLADGFWMLHRGKLFSGSPDDENYHAFGFNTAGIVVKR